MTKSDEKCLRALGYRITPQRAAVLEALGEVDGHISPQELHARMLKHTPGIGLVTIYRSLKMLSGAGLVCEVEFNNGSRHYTRRAPVGHHHHLICRGCEGVVDFGDCGMPDLARELAERTGFTITEHRLELYGLCRQCQMENLKHQGSQT
jgi:Fe2+ or Zn2+ uptake regulation protein